MWDDSLPDSVFVRGSVYRVSCMEGKKKCGVSLTAFTRFGETGYIVIMGGDTMEDKPNGCLTALGVIAVIILLLLFVLWASCGFPGL